MSYSQSKDHKVIRNFTLKQGNNVNKRNSMVSLILVKDSILMHDAI
jgi:hypothetical protein